MAKTFDPRNQHWAGEPRQHPADKNCTLLSIVRVDRSQLYPLGPSVDTDTMTDYHTFSVLARDGAIFLGNRKRKAASSTKPDERALPERLIVGDGSLRLAAGGEKLTRLLVEVHDRWFDAGNLDRWEEVVECELDAPLGYLDVSNLATNLKNVIEVRPGPQRARIYFRTDFTDKPFIRVALWEAQPTTQQGTLVLKSNFLAGSLSDGNGAIEAFVADLFKSCERERELLHRRVQHLRASGKLSEQLLMAIKTRCAACTSEFSALEAEIHARPVAGGDKPIDLPSAHCD